MSMHVSKTKLDQVLLIEPPTIHEDFRGMNVETYNQKLYQESGIGVSFIHDAISVSSKNVLRGIHGDGTTWKLISCLFGQVYFVVVNNDKDSAQYRNWQSFTLSDRNRLQVLVPPKFGNAHLVMSEHAVFSYKQSAYYNREGQFTLYWNDPTINIWWPIKDPVLSERDAGTDSHCSGVKKK